VVDATGVRPARATRGRRQCAGGRRPAAAAVAPRFVGPTRRGRERSLWAPSTDRPSRRRMPAHGACGHDGTAVRPLVPIEVTVESVEFGG